jgi:2-amino-4-hydroxy-6-hydroxymethyldihydropteridine diphosphokinase/dihydropteroate synthase
MASLDKSLQCVLPAGNGKVWAWSNQTHVMGILNATPDSFSDGGLYLNAKAAAESAAQMVNDGVDIIDIGGQSTRPGAEVLEPDEEWERVKPVLEAITDDERFEGIPVSIDTFYSQVAERAVAAGATMVNDISGGKGDSAMFDAVADLGVPYIMMHIRGDPRTMHERSLQVYENICKEVGHSLSESCKEASLAGIESWRLVLDPGIGFSKSTDGNLSLIAGIQSMRQAMESPFQNLPILVGPSRKKFLGDVTGRESPLDREWATCAVSAISALQGANIIRVHNVKAVKDAVKVADSISSRLYQ